MRGDVANVTTPKKRALVWDYDGRRKNARTRNLAPYADGVGNLFPNNRFNLSWKLKSHIPISSLPAVVGLHPAP